jgi:hypothetical protein
MLEMNELAHCEAVADNVIEDLIVNWADKLGGPHPWTETPQMSSDMFDEVKRLLLKKIQDIDFYQIYAE